MKLKFKGKNKSKADLGKGYVNVQPGVVYDVSTMKALGLIESGDFELVKDFSAKDNKMMHKTVMFKSK